MSTVRAESLPSASCCNICVAAPFVRGRNNLVLASEHWAWMFNSSRRHLIKKQKKGRLTGTKAEQTGDYQVPPPCSAGDKFNEGATIS